MWSKLTKTSWPIVEAFYWVRQPSLKKEEIAKIEKHHMGFTSTHLRNRLVGDMTWDDWEFWSEPVMPPTEVQPSLYGIFI